MYSTSGRGQNRIASIYFERAWQKADFAQASPETVDELADRAVKAHALALKAQKEIKRSVRG